MDEGTLKAGYGLLHGGDSAAKICAFQSCRHGNRTLEIFTADFGLAGKLDYGCERTQGGRVPAIAHHQGVLQCVQ